MYDDKSSDNLQFEMLSEVDEKYNKSVGSFVWDILKAVAIKIAEIYTNLTTVYDRFDINKLIGDDLDIFITQRTGLTRTQATKSTGVLTATGTGTVNIGDLFETESGIQFQATQTKAITTSDTINIECTIAGTIGNVEANTILYMPVTLQGITSCTNGNAISGGYEEETNNNFRDRYLDYVRNPVLSGNKASYLTYAKSVAGVGDAKVIPLWNGANTVKILIIDADKQPANTTLIDTVQEFIDPNSSGLGEGVAPLGAYCTVSSATAKNINITVTVTKSTAFTQAEVTTNVQESIVNYLKSIAFNQNYVSYAMLSYAILTSQGVTDSTSLLVNSGVVNITLTDAEVARLGSLVITYA